jgi:single-stranded-DNA-specific exonuclease
MKSLKENWKLRDDSVSTVEDIVTKHTGMDTDILLKDRTKYEINNLGTAAALFMKHIRMKSKIWVYADYDADGINSACIMKLLFDPLHADYCILVPRRFTDGYGVKPANIEQMDSGLLITVDNGIAAVEAIAEAKKKGLDVIILDHHQSRKDEDGNILLPDADVIVDPHITGGTFDDYCGAGLAYKFSMKVFSMCTWMSDKQKLFLESRMVSFAAIATVADGVSLTGENRKIVSRGISRMNGMYCTPGLQKLLYAKYLNFGYITGSDLGFSIGPVYNAYGRLEDNGSREVFRTMTADEKEADVEQLVETLVAKNEERKELSKIGFERAKMAISQTEQKDDRFIVLYDDQISLGIAGLVAGNVTEEYKRPSIVFAPSGKPGYIKGSGRSVDGVNLKAILDENNRLIDTYGGHPAACGIQIKEENLAAFKDAVEKSAPPLASGTDDEVLYDLTVAENDLGNFMDEIDKFGPYGNGNPEIVIRVDNIHLVPGAKGFCEPVGKTGEHAKLHAKEVELVWFDGMAAYKEMGSPVKISVVGIPSRHVFREDSKVQIQILAVVSEEPEKSRLEDRLMNL